MSALPSQQWPSMSVPPALVWSAVFPLPIAVMVVPPPTGTAGCIHLENPVDDVERIFNEGIARLADAVANQFKEPRIHNVFGREGGWLPRRLVSQLQDIVVGLFIGLGIVNVRGMNA